MIRRISIAAAASLLVIGIASPLASAQAQKPPEPKGVKVTGLVTSLGGFSATVNTPLLITGSTVELEPGGQTGKQQFRVPTFIYVLEGTLTTNYEIRYRGRRRTSSILVGAPLSKPLPIDGAGQARARSGTPSGE